MNSILQGNPSFSWCPNHDPWHSLSQCGHPHSRGSYKPPPHTSLKLILFDHMVHLLPRQCRAFVINLESKLKMIHPLFPFLIYFFLLCNRGTNRKSKTDIKGRIQMRIHIYFDFLVPYFQIPIGNYFSCVL